eukprot:1158406-Pelagomonas_calceolata.AAC.2
MDALMLQRIVKTCTGSEPVELVTDSVVLQSLVGSIPHLRNTLLVGVEAISRHGGGEQSGVDLQEYGCEPCLLDKA